jgi:thiamine-phosphate pyrophosphorylase
MDDSSLDRILDANLNRLTEGLRVVEDVVRLGLENKRLLLGVRALRTKVGRDARRLRRRAMLSRDSETDPGRGDRFDKTKRRSLEDVLFANFKRAEESCRVLEEVLKIAEPKLAAGLKSARFRLYDLEKRAAEIVTETRRRMKPEG